MTRSLSTLSRKSPFTNRSNYRTQVSIKPTNNYTTASVMRVPYHSCAFCTACLYSRHRKGSSLPMLLLFLALFHGYMASLQSYASNLMRYLSVPYIGT